MGRAIIFLLLCPALAWADTLYLKDGRIVRGEVISETDEVVSVKEPIGTSGYAQARYPKSQVERIERGLTERGETLAQVVAPPPTAASNAPAEQVKVTTEAVTAARLRKQREDALGRQTAKGDISRLSSALESYKSVSGEFPMTLKLGEMFQEFLPLAEVT